MSSHSTDRLDPDRDVGHLERLRRWEMEQISATRFAGVDVIEIGGGNGYQAALLSTIAKSVRSFDISTSDRGYHPVETYDGYTLPIANRSVGGIFSSNVFEHVPDLETLLRELHRVLSPNGEILTVLPTSTWRLWTSVMHYPFAIKYLITRHAPTPSFAPTPRPDHRRGVLGRLRRVVSSGPHGEFPSAIHELWAFSQRRWTRVFRDAGFTVEVTSSGLFYTGYSMCQQLPKPARLRLARLVGSSSKAYVLRRDG